jgi:hypothetical protein
MAITVHFLNILVNTLAITLPGDYGMALQSPGVEVTVIDESFYTPAEPGTTPLIVVATAQNKTNPAGALAAATTKANAGKAFRLTSQRDLVDLFGVPFFEKTASNTPIHGSERNEYGLLSAYSLLGVTNSVFMVRADVDLSQLEGRADAPGANPRNGAWWIDTQATSWGIQEWNGAARSTTGGQKFTTKIPLVLTDDDADNKFDGDAPAESVGSIGDYAVVFRASDGDIARIYYKSAGSFNVPAGSWVLVGSNDWCASHPAAVGTTVTSLVSGDLIINNVTVPVTGGQTLVSLVAAINGAGIQGVTAKAVTGRLYLYTDGANDVAGDSSRSNAVVISGDDVGLGIAEGTYYGPALQMSPHTQVPQWKDSGTGQTKRPTGSVWIKTTEPNNGARWRAKQWSSSTTSWLAVESPIYQNTHSALFNLDRAGGGINLPVDTLFAQYNSEEHSGFDTDPATATFKVWRRAASGFTTITSTTVGSGTQPAGNVSFTIRESVRNSSELNSITVSATLAGNDSDAITLASAINAAGFANIEASVSGDNTNRLIIQHKLGGDFRLSSGTADFISDLFVGSENLYELPTAAADTWLASNWQPFSQVAFAASGDAPLEEPVDGQLWYNPEFSEVDIMLHNGDTWVGYNSTNGGLAGAQIIVAASEPELTSGQKAIDRHIWISTADLENFPTIYRWNKDAAEWDLIDKTDQITEDGILFADARYGVSGATGDTAANIDEYRTSDYIDPDAPDPALYPRGMLLWNLRRSGGNVKVYRNGYINTAADNTRFDPLNTGGESMADYAEDRWVTASGNQEDGSGSFGRKAQRKVIVQALKSVVDTSQEIRDEERRNFNLIAAPGYPELLSNIVNLNIDRGLTAFVVGDTPLRLPADATSLTTWGTNANLVTDNGDDGIVTYDEYAAVFYPNGFTTDLGGANAVVPASHMMLRTIALSDQVSYPWFAPAGTRRGGITNATAVGYVDALSGEFQTVSLNEGQRDVLYDLKVNPITFFNGVGLVNYGQKTRARNASALDRINVARLVVYLRSQLQKLARPYVFEPNDKITRDEVKQAVESLLLELVGLRALYDFAVVCDESNNTPARIDRNELWVDIAIEPVKAIEFIYIPLRVKNTGEI